MPRAAIRRRWGDTGIALHLSEQQSSPTGAHLRSFRAEYGAKARAGLLLHAGQGIEWLAPDVLAVPWWKVF